MLASGMGNLRVLVSTFSQRLISKPRDLLGSQRSRLPRQHIPSGQRAHYASSQLVAVPSAAGLGGRLSVGFSEEYEHGLAKSSHLLAQRSHADKSGVEREHRPAVLEAGLGLARVEETVVGG